MSIFIFIKPKLCWRVLQKLIAIRELCRRKHVETDIDGAKAIAKYVEKLMILKELSKSDEKI